MNGRRRAGGARRGLAATEFALVLPLLVTAVLGCIDFGRFASACIALTNAARAGAGFGSVNPTTAATVPAWQARVRQAVLDELGGQTDVDAEALTVTVVPVTDSGIVSGVQVGVEYLFAPLIPWPGMPTALTVRQTVVMRVVCP